MKKLLLAGLLLFSTLAHSAINEQDRAVLERGRQLLANPGFEARKSEWTPSGTSVFAIVTGSSSLGIGAKAATWNPGATGENLDTDLKVVPIVLEGNSCSASFKYLWASGVSGEIKLQVLDSGGSVDAREVDLEPTTGTALTASLVFTCESAESHRHHDNV